MSSIIKGINRESSLPAPSAEFRVNVPGYGSLSLEALKRHVKALSNEFNELVQTEEFIKAAYKTEQFYNALFALSKAMKSKTDSSMEEGYSAGASGGSGLGIEKSPMEKVLEKPLGEHIGSPGGMGQAYRKFTPKTSGLQEDASKLHIGDRVIITGNVEFQGEKGDIENFGRLKAFVVVHLDNYGSRSFHSSDVSSYDEDEYQESAIMKGLNRE